MNGYHQETINMSESRTGEEIVNALKEIAKESRDLRFVYTGIRGLPPRIKAGFNSKYESKRCVVLTGTNLDKPEIEFDQDYSRIAIGTEKWLYNGFTGEEATQESIEISIKKITTQIKEKLERLSRKGLENKLA